MVDHEAYAHLVDLVAADPDRELTVDLESQVVHLPDDLDLPFEVDAFARAMLLAGTDELGWLVARNEAIDAYEAAHPQRVDTLAGAAPAH